PIHPETPRSARREPLPDPPALRGEGAVPGEHPRQGLRAALAALENAERGALPGSAVLAALDAEGDDVERAPSLGGVDAAGEEAALGDGEEPLDEIGGGDE